MKTPDGYVIATDSRKRDEILFMVDRAKCKLSFWSCSLRDAFIYADQPAALQKAGSFKYNNPRVLTVDAAKQLSKKTQKDKAYDFYVLNMIPHPTEYCDKLLCQSGIGRALYAKRFHMDSGDF